MGKTGFAKGVLLLKGGIGGGFAAGVNSSDGSHFYYGLAPYAGIGYRNYYNIFKRIERGKKTLNNSANFFAIDLLEVFPILAASNAVEKSKSFGTSIYTCWGMQRSLSKSFNFEWKIGGGVGTNNFNRCYFVPRLGVAFSYLLKK